MPAESLLAILIAAIAANVLLVVAVALILWADRRRDVRPAQDGRTPAARALERDPGDKQPGQGLPTPDPSPAGSYDRIVRIVAWLFLLSVTTLVAVTGLWPDTQTAIFILLTLAGLFLLTVHDLISGRVASGARYVMEGSVAITFATILVLLTGGPQSPFFFAYALIVVGTALVLSSRMAFVVAFLAVVGYGVGVLADPARLPLSNAQIVAVGVNSGALLLLCFVGMVVAREQRRTRDAAIQLSTIDSLTGLYNRGYFFAAIEREIQRSARSGRGFCLLMMDLDGLKPINDRFGHFNGDRVIRGVSEVIRHGVRRIDTAARYGGDEFVVLLPETEPGGAYVLAEKIRQGVTELSIETRNDHIQTSLSIGVVAYPDDGRTSDELMITADQAMYASKRRGKNRIVGYGGGTFQAPRQPYAPANHEEAGVPARGGPANPWIGGPPDPTEPTGRSV